MLDLFNAYSQPFYHLVKKIWLQMSIWLRWVFGLNLFAWVLWIWQGDLARAMTRSEELNARLAQQSAELNRAFQALTSLNSLWVPLPSISMCAHHLTSAINFRSFSGTCPHCVELGWGGISGTSQCYQALRIVYCKYVKRILTLCFHSVQNLRRLIRVHNCKGLDH